jgi:G:T/U-mismatch repair DNA glycosylase
MPHVRAGDVEEKRLGNWIANNKNKEKGTNSEREQLMKSEIPLAFEYNDRQVRDVKWRDYLASAKTFIDTENRIPNTRAGDVEEKRLGIWIVNNKRNEKGTNSEREQLMKSEIPIAFACVGESS